MANVERTHRVNLPYPSPYGFLAGPLGGLILRPWFDRLAVHLVARWYLPMSRGWAAAAAADGSFERFRDAVGPAADRLGRAKSDLVELFDRKRLYRERNTEWNGAFFGEDAPDEEKLIACETDRVRAANDYMMMRRAFLPLRRALPAARWDVATPEEVERTQARRLSGDIPAFPAPEEGGIEESHPVPAVRGMDFWIRMKAPSAVAGDTAWARVKMPSDGQVRGVLIVLHGIFVEPEMWCALVEPMAALVERGICLVSPEGPWHGRRCPDGDYGGERIMARGPLGFIELFEAWTAECAAWIAWARGRFSAPVALGGISLGALSGQMAVSASPSWPAEMRPDACILITTTRDMTHTALEGSLAHASGLHRELVKAGWHAETLAAWEDLVAPVRTPPLAPEKIVMVLGEADTITPYAGGKALSTDWQVPPRNLFIRPKGHFSAALNLGRDRESLDRIVEILAGAG